jgi:NAD(P)-dependent dehydrogenase (short-subunit alcohol dehydrogenase family)
VTDNLSPGTAGCGRASVEALAKHAPKHIYFTGRKSIAAENVIKRIQETIPGAALTFLETDFSSFASIRAAAAKFVHNRLDILICNAGIMEVPPQVSTDGFEMHMAVNHLSHALLVHELLPILLRTADLSDSDVRVVFVTSNAWKLRSGSAGIWYDKLHTKMDGITVSWARYG